MPFAYATMASMLALLLYLILTGTEHVAGHFMEMGAVQSSLMVGLGVTATYIIALYKPRIEALSSIGTFLSDRMYMPFLNDFIVPKIGWAVAWLVSWGNAAIDWFCHSGIPAALNKLSMAIRSIQIGYLRAYMKIALGFVMLAIVVSVVGWW